MDRRGRYCILIRARRAQTTCPHPHCALKETHHYVMLPYLCVTAFLPLIPPAPYRLIIIITTIRRSEDRATHIDSWLHGKRHFNPLKPQLVWTIFKNSVRTAKKTQLFTITKDQLVNAMEITDVQTENYMKPINTKCSYRFLKQVEHIVTTGL
jgi:hypothetical protein